MRADASAGRRPFLVVASAGTTNTGAIDPLGPKCDVAPKYGAWVHADAAYGGFFLLTERGLKWLTELQRCDSVTLDPHKGSLAVRNRRLGRAPRRALTRAFGRTPRISET